MKKITTLLIFLSAIMPLWGVTTTLMKKTDRHAMNRWVDSVYNSLTERQRVGQLIIAKVVPTHGEKSKASIVNLVGKHGIGGLLFTQGSLEQFITHTNNAQAAARIPVLMTLDGEWGLSMRVNDVGRFVNNMAIGAGDSEKLAQEYGREVGKQCRLAGIHVNFAPDADVNSNPANPVIGYRSFGENPERVAALVSAYSKGLEDMGVQAVAKHFPGHGDTSGDSHKTLPLVGRSRSDLNKIELVPFRQFINDGCSGIMMGHISVPAIDKSGTASSLSPTTYKMLRNDMGFEGLIYTDALGMQGASAKGKDNAVQALKAGADLLLAPTNPVQSLDAIMEAIKTGQISKKDVEAHVRRVLAYKYALGLSKHPDPISMTQLKARIDSHLTDQVARQLAAASMTCLKNTDNLLPLKQLSNRHIAIVNFSAKPTVFTNICQRYAPSTLYNCPDGVISEAQMRAIKQANTVIVAIYDDKQGVRSSVARLSGCKNMIGVFMVNPYKMAKFSNSLSHMQSVILAYDDTEASLNYAAQAVFGGIDVTGKLPVNLKNIGRIGTGIKLNKIRLGYSTPGLNNMDNHLTVAVDSIMEDALARKAIPGAQVLIGRHGNIILDKCYGLLTEHGADVNDQTMYDLASVSKAIGTLPGIMKAYDEGLIGLDVPASKYIPGLNRDDKRDITISDLLYHESGMPASLNMFDIMIDTASYNGRLITSKPDNSHSIKIQNGAYGNNTGKLRRDITSTTKRTGFETEAAKGIWVGQAAYDTIMGRIYNIPLRKNKNYNYSCLNFCLLMNAEQNVTGLPHDQYVSEKIWRPLGMTTMSYRPTETHPKSQIAPTEKDNYLRRQTVHGYVHDETAAFSGGLQGNAGLFSNADDIAKMCQMWLNGGTYGGERILSTKTVNLFTTSKSPTCRRGLGFDKPDKVNPDWSPTTDMASPETYGHLGFTGTVFWVDPANDMFMIFLTNRVNPTRDNDAFNETYLRADLYKQLYLNLND
ncbi:MAG: serine hydrolase [Muribaculaceae bacterium]|nr:serine hydrolase [Muribaculaceae bacterium]